jgi:hypothetical protein
LSLSGDERKVGAGDACNARVRYAEKDSAAKEAMAGAPRIYYALQILESRTSCKNNLHGLDSIVCFLYTIDFDELCSMG